MFCRKCGNELKDDEKVCSKCGCDLNNYTTNLKNNDNGKSSKPYLVLKIGLYILAFIVICMAFDGADKIEIAASNMSNLRSVGGQTVAEAYYQYYGRFLYGVATLVQAIGITLGVIIAYISSRINKLL